MKFNPLTGEMEESTNVISVECRGFYQLEKELSNIKSPKKGNFAIVMGDIQKTFEFDGEEWINSNELYMPTGKSGKDAEPPVSIKKLEISEGNLVISYTNDQEVNLGKIVGEDAVQISSQDIINDLKADSEFIASIKGKDGQGSDGKDAKIEDVVKILINDQKFLDSIKGKDGKGIDGISPTAKDIANELKNDEEFVVKTQGKSIKGKDADPVDVREVAKELLSIPEFIELTKGKDGESIKGNDGISPTVESISKSLMNNPMFIDMVKGKDCEATALDIANELKKDLVFVDSIRGKDGNSIQGAPGKDGESISIGFSPDGVNNITDTYKDGDKFMYVRVGVRRANTFQILK